MSMKAKRLLHTRLRISNLEESIKFFTQVLGMNVVRQTKSPRGSVLTFLRIAGSEEEIELCYYPESGKVDVPPDLIHLAFEVDNLEQFGIHSSKLGYPFSDGPTITSSGTKFAFIDGPDGYEIELIERKENDSI
ncbi:VOC family protein [Methylacidiphilum caldifontis]|uniref:Aldoketomutase n=1 Tax=Methylacidiphilum caldifontis TaxID=2795386 RepID=A0A4Y8PFD1_9BACT|nr:VOC family protein [Methylacidiphilum caldifontis]QSR88380.1 VOC family protein [Methylacidiphilum caldifontis]TFE70749.1 glyoxalase [Methylacidiphilum caldifontis]